jgi:hypothetical protein
VDGVSAEIERLSIRVPGLERDGARRLAQLVAMRLAGDLAPAPGEVSLERLSAELTTRPGESQEALADRIAGHLVMLVGEAATLEGGR